MNFYSRLVSLYPDDIRFAYEDELVADLQQRHNVDQQVSPVRLCIGIAKRTVSTLFDISIARAHCIYSHRSFRGRARPDASVVRPPNMGKQEWFGRL